MLCIVCHFTDCVKIWVMDHSGWEKKYNISSIVPMFRMRGLWKNGDQLLGGKDGKSLASYDHEGNSLCQFQIDVDYIIWISGFMSMCQVLLPCQHSYFAYVLANCLIKKEHLQELWSLINYVYKSFTFLFHYCLWIIW